MIDVRNTRERKLLSDLPPIHSQTIDDRDVSLSVTVVRSRLWRASSLFAFQGLERVFTYQDPLEVCFKFPGTMEKLMGHAAASKLATPSLRMLGLPEDLPARDLPTKFICNCGNPDLTMPLTYTQLMLHLLIETQWYEDMVANLKADHDPSLILHNDHDLTSSEPFIYVFTDQPLSMPIYNLEDLCHGSHARSFGCAECENLSGVVSRDCRDESSIHIYPEGIQLVAHSRNRFAHHIQTKHVRTARHDDALYLLKQGGGVILYYH
ncbi:hypothetical protein QCA50_019554 [Cerrena zonata]|uniref:Uncharacterized protein n=1 Tax=Cerrena zonata TaxID=2478898 RepID=A0AAW0FAL2_9APHY